MCDYGNVNVSSAKEKSLISVNINEYTKSKTILLWPGYFNSNIYITQEKKIETEEETKSGRWITFEDKV